MVDRANTLAPKGVFRMFPNYQDKKVTAIFELHMVDRANTLAPKGVFRMFPNYQNKKVT
jgi:hypothetical protein